MIYELSAIIFVLSVKWVNNFKDVSDEIER